MPRFIQMDMPLPAPPESDLPHALIDPSALRAAKACPFE
jgi:hypothetical protein